MLSAELLTKYNHPGHYGLGGFFLTTGGKFGRIYVRPTLFVVVAITTMKKSPCTTSRAGIMIRWWVDLLTEMIYLLLVSQHR